MNSNINYIAPLLDKAEEYGKTSYDLLKLRTVDKTSELFSSFLSRGVVLIALAVFLLFLSIGGAIWLGAILGELYYGFLGISVFYGVLGAVLFLFRNSMKRCFGDAIVSKILSE